jgi:hypothetical protein
MTIEERRDAVYEWTKEVAQLDEEMKSLQSTQADVLSGLALICSSKSQDTSTCK